MLKYNLPIIKRILKQLSKEVPTTKRAIAKLQKLLQNTVATEPKNPTPLDITRAGSRP